MIILVASDIFNIIKEYIIYIKKIRKVFEDILSKSAKEFMLLPLRSKSDVFLVELLFFQI